MSDNYKQCAQKTFDKLKKVFSTNTNYWQLGHSFDTIIDYLITNPADADGFAEIALDRYNSSTDSACWFDDYGWWGIAALKASQNPQIFGSSVAHFRKIAGACWKTMYVNAPNVWKNADQAQFKDLKPRFDGGVWNADWTAVTVPGRCEVLTPCIARLDSDPQCNGEQGSNLCGIQNTVTNGLYLVLTARLAEVFPDQHYLAEAQREFGFLNNWIRNVDNPEQRLMIRTVEKGSIVRERVGTFAKNSEGKYPGVCGYQPELAWSGDQGLILGGLVDLMRLLNGVGPEYTALLVLAREIAYGVKYQIETYHNGIMTAWITDAQGGDPGDYDTGIAVFMRYLIYAYSNNNSLREHLQALGYSDFVRKNADAVINNPQTDLVGLTNDLATLVAAIRMVNQEPIA